MKKKLIAVLIFIIALITAPPSAHGFWGMMGGCCGWWPFHGFMGWGFGIFGFLLMLFIFYLFFRFLGRAFFIGRRDDLSAFEELKKRYARGEITKEEFEKIKRDLLNI